MSDECIVGEYDSLGKAEQAVRILYRGDFPAAQISLVASGLEGTPALVEDCKLGDDSLRDLAIGAGLGGVMGLIAGIGFAAMPGLGFVFLIGPIAADIGLTGAMVGAFLGSLVGWGVHEDRIRHYEQCIKDGRVLVIVNGNPLEIVRAERILKETDVVDVHLHARSSSDSPEVLDG